MFTKSHGKIERSEATNENHFHNLEQLQSKNGNFSHTVQFLPQSLEQGGGKAV